MPAGLLEPVQCITQATDTKKVKRTSQTQAKVFGTRLYCTVKTCATKFRWTACLLQLKSLPRLKKSGTGMSSLIDLKGQRFGLLTVIERAPDRETSGGHKKTMWHCLCDCGNHKKVMSDNLRSGNTISCGCYRYVKSKRQRTPGSRSTKQLSKEYASARLLRLWK